jgi:hypothetical protein
MFIVFETVNTKYVVMYEGIEDFMPYSIIDENGDVMGLFKYVDEAEKISRFLNTSTRGTNE